MKNLFFALALILGFVVNNKVALAAEEPHPMTGNWKLIKTSCDDREIPLDKDMATLLLEVDGLDLVQKQTIDSYNAETDQMEKRVVHEMQSKIEFVTENKFRILDPNDTTGAKKNLTFSYVRSNELLHIHLKSELAGGVCKPHEVTTSTFSLLD